MCPALADASLPVLPPREPDHHPGLLAHFMPEAGGKGCSAIDALFNHNAEAIADA